MQIKYVICVNNVDYPISLSEGVEYEVIGEDSGMFMVVNDQGEDYLYPKSIFHINEYL